MAKKTPSLLYLCWQGNVWVSVCLCACCSEHTTHTRTYSRNIRGGISFFNLFFGRDKRDLCTIVWVGVYFGWIKRDVVRVFQFLPTVTGHGYAGTGQCYFGKIFKSGFEEAEIDLARRERREQKHITTCVVEQFLCTGTVYHHDP